MLKLHARLNSTWDAEPAVLRITDSSCYQSGQEGQEAYLVQAAEVVVPAGFHTYIGIHTSLSCRETGADALCIRLLPEELDYLAAGDIVYLRPRTADIWILYRRKSLSNSLLVTERCNSRCLMCSQPPKDSEDFQLTDTILQAIPLMDPATPELGITGGEPTLLGTRLIHIIQACATHLPKTALHILSNGRLFQYVSLCQELAQVGHSDLMIGIPLYSDIASKHDFVVQAKGAFDQTVRGIMNLERCGIDVEIRVVLHRQTITRLPQLARYIARNLPFVNHVALMGLEMMGYVRMNMDALWIDPVAYQSQLTDAVQLLNQHGLQVSIYNHQLCTLPQELWPYARKSISDWKNEYLDVCGECDVQHECGGFFFSASIRHSTHIQPLKDTPTEVITAAFGSTVDSSNQQRIVCSK